MSLPLISVSYLERERERERESERERERREGAKGLRLGSCAKSHLESGQGVMRTRQPGALQLPQCRRFLWRYRLLFVFR
jgi:hypothetical protein